MLHLAFSNTFITPSSAQASWDRIVKTQSYLMMKSSPNFDKPYQCSSQILFPFPSTYKLALAWKEFPPAILSRATLSCMPHTSNRRVKSISHSMEFLLRMIMDKPFRTSPSHKFAAHTIAHIIPISLHLQTRPRLERVPSGHIVEGNTFLHATHIE